MFLRTLSTASLFSHATQAFLNFREALFRNVSFDPRHLVLSILPQQAWRCAEYEAGGGNVYRSQGK